MGLFHKSKIPTRMFVSHTTATKDRGHSSQKKSLDISDVSTVVTKKIAEIAPELVEEGFKLLSSTIAGFTEDYTSETILYKNIDGSAFEPIFIPKHITLIRADFEDDRVCGDDYGDNRSGCLDLKRRELHIELNLKKSHYTQNFYFQPTHYYYIGKDNKGKSIDEINISFAFVEASKDISDFKDIEFKKVISFKNLDNNRDYDFYEQQDTTFQSPWISSELSKMGPYTIAIKIEERRYSKPFATTLNKIYKKHEEELKRKINQELEKQLDKIKKE